MTSLERVTTALRYEEPDRVPFFLPLTMHGAKEMDLSIRDYFSGAANVVEGQLRMLDKYKHDFVFTFFYAALEVEAWGGEVVFFPDGPPNSGQPLIGDPESIRDLVPPRVNEAPCLKKVIEVTRGLKDKIGDTTPIMGIVMSPFSLPIMQMGFSAYVELIYERPEFFRELMLKNQAFCLDWANAQIEAGATVIGYFDPMSSPTIIPEDIYLKTGFNVAKETIAKINGPTATLMASGRCLPILDKLAETGTKAAIVGSDEDLGEAKKTGGQRLSIIGNLNGIAMRRWNKKQTEDAVKDALAKGGPGGGFILSDQHGEIPFQVPDEVLQTISETARKWGRYPLDWVGARG